MANDRGGERDASGGESRSDAEAEPVAHSRSVCSAIDSGSSGNAKRG